MLPPGTISRGSGLFCERLAQLALEDLARAAFGQRLHEAHVFGNLEVREAGARVLDQFRHVELRARLEDDDGRGTSPHFSSGTPMTAHSSTAG